MPKMMDLFLSNISNSEHLDEVLGFNVSNIEQGLLQKAKALRPTGNMSVWGSALHEGNQTWVGLSLATLQTPYIEIKQICELIEPRNGERVLDLGAGYGRMGIVLNLLYPKVHFLGLEYVEQRVLAGTKVLDKWGCSNAKLLQQDLTAPDFELPEAEYYFIYDYGKVGHIRQTLNQLSRMGDRRSIKVIARGAGTRSLIEQEHPWLSNSSQSLGQNNFSFYSM